MVGARSDVPCMPSLTIELFCLDNFSSVYKMNKDVIIQFISVRFSSRI